MCDFISKLIVDWFIFDLFLCAYNGWRHFNNKVFGNSEVIPSVISEFFIKFLDKRMLALLAKDGDFLGRTYSACVNKTIWEISVLLLSVETDMSQNPRYSPSAQLRPKAGSDTPQVCKDLCIHFWMASFILLSLLSNALLFLQSHRQSFFVFPVQTKCRRFLKVTCKELSKYPA